MLWTGTFTAAILQLGIALLSDAATGCGLLFLSTCALRIYSLARSLAWITIHGTSSMSAVREARSTQELTAAYRRHEGLFFPFGVRSILLTSIRMKTRSSTLRVVVTLFQVFWRFYVFAPVGFVVLVAASQAAHTSVSRLLFYLSGVALLIGGLTIVLEGLIALRYYGSWLRDYHRVPSATPTRGYALMLLATGVVAIYVASAGSLQFVAQQYEGFEKIPSDLTVAQSLGLSAYYTLTAFTGNGDPGPLNANAYWLMALLFLAGWTCVAVFIGLLVNLLSQARAS